MYRVPLLLGIFLVFVANSFAWNGQPNVWMPSEGITIAQATNEILAVVSAGVGINLIVLSRLLKVQGWAPRA